MALLDRIREVNRTLSGRAYYRLYANDIAVGHVDTQLLDELDAALFVIDSRQRRVDVCFASTERSEFEAHIATFFQQFFAKHRLGGWRNELYAVKTHFAGEPLFLLERAALSLLGITGYGVHINGYVENADGLHLWVAKRALTKPTSPGKLDQIAAGGCPYGIALMENVIKECEEEASIPRHLAETAIPVSANSYWYEVTPFGVRPDVNFNYDLKLPADFVPQTNDDEVESFALRHIDEVLEQLAQTQDFKFNSAVVIIDFAIRHGVITPAHPDYVALQAGMLQQPYS